MRPGPGAGAFGQPGHRFAQGGRLQRPGAVGDLGGQVPSGLRRGGHQATPLSKLSRPQHGVVVGQAPDLDVGRRGRAPHAEPVAAQPTRRGDVRRVDHTPVAAPQPGRSATDRPSQNTGDPVQIGDHLRPPADHCRVDGVVVGIQAHVVVAGQP